MIKKTNTVAIFCDDQAIFTHNSMLNFVPFLSREPYAKYISVGSGSGLVDDEMDALSSKPTTLSEYNADSSSGQVYGVYIARFTDEDILPGQSVSEAGLCAEIGKKMANYATFPPVVKKAGVDLIVKVEIRLYLSGEIEFTAGENQFALALLGARSCEGATFTMARGDNYHPTGAIPKREKPLEEKDAEVNFSQDGITFSANFSQPCYELIISMNGAPVLRGYNLHGTQSAYYSLAVGESKSVTVSGDRIVTLSGVRVNGSYPPSYAVMDFPRRLTEDCLPLIRHRLPDEYEVLSEHKGNYIGVFSGKEVTVYNLSNKKLSLSYKTDAVNKKPTLVSNGALFLYGGEVELVNATGKRIKTGVTADDLCAVETSGNYLLVARTGNTVKVYRCTSNGVTSLKETLTVGDDFVMTRANQYYIAMLCPSVALYKCVGLNDQFAKVEKLLKTCAENFTDLSFHGSFLTMKNGEERVMIHTLGDEVIEYDEDYIKDDAFIRTNGDKTLSLCVAFGENKAERAMEFVEEIPKAFTFSGGYLFAFYSGKVRVYYPVPCGKTIFSPFFNEGDVVTFTMSTGKEVPTGSGGVRYQVKLTKGE